MFLWISVKKGLTDGIFNISTFSMVLCSFLLSLMKIFSNAHHFLNKTIVKHSLFPVKYIETTINTKIFNGYPLLDHLLHEKLTLKRRNYHVAWLSRYKLFSHTKLFQAFLINKKMTIVNPLFNKKFIIYIYNSLFKKWVSRWNFLHIYFFSCLMLFFTSSNGNLFNDT